MQNSLFNSAQADFIVVVDTAYNSLEEYLADFATFSPAYNAAWLVTARTELRTAETLPNEDERRANSEILRVELAAENRNCCEYWQRLKRYITKAFPANTVDIHLAAAGQNSYRNAYAESWPYTKSMMQSAANFMTGKLSELTANDNMPPGFPAQMNAAATAFNNKLSAYESAKEAIMLATDLKIKALNQVYLRLMPMLLDGQEIFKKEEAIRKQFVYSEILRRVSGPGLAGLRGVITNKADNMPIANARIALVGTSYFTLTGDDGKYELICPSGLYNVGITADQFQPLELQNISVSVGTISALEVQMLPALVPEP